MPSFDAAIGLVRRLGMVEDSRIEKYLSATRSMQKNGLVLDAMLWGVHNARFEQRSAELAKAALG